jgi:DNA replication factor GINS
MDLEDLRAAQADERRSEKLQELSDSFYDDAAGYIKELREERDACDDPYSEDAQRLNDALKSARQVTEAIYERRVGKVVKMASLAANGHTATKDRMTREEREMFSNIVDEIRANQQQIEDILEGALKDGTDETETSTEDNVEEATTEETDDGYATVRVVESLPEFVGTDGREYSLGEEDVARIPEENARALCENEAAVEVTEN